MITEKGDGTTSYLLIQDAELTDSGKYSCAPSNADMASVRVHVLNGEYGGRVAVESEGSCSHNHHTLIYMCISEFTYG